MNYTRNYFEYVSYVQTLNRSKNRGTYYEKHHIIPKCIGGTDNSENLVLLTAREHFLAHFLLCKIYPDNTKLLLAFHKMRSSSTNQQRYYNSRLYTRLKEKLSVIYRERNKTRKVTPETREKLRRSRTGRPLSEETKKKIGASRRGKSRSEETKKQIAETLKGRKFDEEHKRKIAKANSGNNNYAYGKSMSEIRRLAKEKKEASML